MPDSKNSEHEQLSEQEIIELIGVYQRGVDYSLLYQRKRESVIGVFERKISILTKRLENKLATDSQLHRLETLAKERPMPTEEQKARSETAANKIIESSEDLIQSVIKKRFKARSDTSIYDDLFIAGEFGLFLSLAGYDSNNGNFNEYASIFIERAMFEYLEDHYGPHRHHSQGAAENVFSKALEKLKDEKGTPTGLAGVASGIEDDFEIVQNALNRISRTIPPEKDEGDVSAHQVEPIKFAPEEVFDGMIANTLGESLKNLSAEQRLIIDTLYLGNDKSDNYLEAGIKIAKLRSLGAPENELTPVSEDEIIRIRKEALRTLKDSMLGDFTNED